MKRVYLANISGAYQTVLPYSSGVLHAYCLEDPQLKAAYDFQNYIFHVPRNIEEEVNKIHRPSVLGISLLSWNHRRSLKLARLVKEKFPDCLVIVGGPEVPDSSQDFLSQNPFIDIAVHKEGEEIFRRILLENLGPRPDWKNIPGISFRDGQDIISNKRDISFLNPINSPSPYLLGLFDEAIKYLDAQGLPRVTVWETNRGCPYRCTFCDWGSATNQKLRLVDEPRIRAEIDIIARTFDEVHLADANFGIIKRDVEIAQKLSHLIQSGERLKSIHINYVKNLNDSAVEIAENLEALKISRAGFTFAFNSLDAQTLKNIKRYNIPREKFVGLKRKLDLKSIPTNAELIWGLPGETVQSFLDGFELCMEVGLTDIRTYQLNIYPNSEINDADTREKFGIQTDWIKIVNGASPDEDEYIETVISTDRISAEAMWSVKKAVEVMDIIHFGRWTYYLATYLKKANGIKLTAFYLELFNFFIKRPESIIARIVRGNFIDEYNSGYWNSFRGPKSPFGVEWGQRFFRKGTFFWLCIAESRELFFQEIADFLKHFAGDMDQELLRDLITYQREMIIDFGYDPAKGKNISTLYDWPAYFSGEREEIQKGPINIILRDQTVGRFEKKLAPHCPDVFFHVAGGYDFHFQKMRAFEFRDITVLRSPEVKFG